MDKKNILIIDDNPMMLGELSRILLPDYHVQAVPDGATGLNIANKDEVDLILLDIVMKDMSGYDVLNELKQNDRTKDIPVIFITGTNGGGEEVRALSSGAVDYIKKPFIPEIVRLRVGIHMRLLTQMRIIERFSLTDGLTGINNRRYFDQQLESEWNRAARNGTPLSILMLDIDLFKGFNDRFGHLNGDTALKTVADVLVKTIRRGTDYVFRWGGEEFAIILPETPIEGAVKVAEKIRANIATTPIIMGKEPASITASLGVASTIPAPASFPREAAEFCEKLDQALYKAKHNGRNRVEVIE